MFKIFGDMLNAFRGGCVECGTKEGVLLCEYCHKPVCPACLKRDPSFKLEPCPKSTALTKKHSFKSLAELSGKS